MATMIVALILAFTGGVLIGIVIGDALPKKIKDEAEKALDLNKDGTLDLKDAKIALDLNDDGKVDTKDLAIAKTELKKTASQVTKLAKKVK